MAALGPAKRPIRGRQEVTERANRSKTILELQKYQFILYVRKAAGGYVGSVIGVEKEKSNKNRKWLTISALP